MLVRSKYDLWRYLQARMQDRSEEMHLASGFFTLTNLSLFSDIIVSLFKLYEEKAQDGSLYKFLGIVSDSLSLFDYKESPDDSPLVSLSTIKKDKEEIRWQYVAIGNLSTWRSKVFAHNDRKYYLDRNRLLQDASLTNQDIEVLIDLAWKIVNKYCLALDGSSYYPEVPNAKDVGKVLDILHDYRQQKMSKADALRANILGMGFMITNEQQSAIDLENIMDDEE